MVNGYRYTVIGVLAKKKQNGSYGSGPDNTQLFTHLLGDGARLPSS